MRILLLTPMYPPRVGGLEILVHEIAKALRARGDEVLVVTSHGDETESGLAELDGVSVLRVEAHRPVGDQDPGRLLRTQREIARVTRDFDAEIVHAHDLGPVLWLYQRATRDKPKPLVVTSHNVMSRHLSLGLEVFTKLLRSADAVTGVSDAVVRDLVSLEPSIASRSSVIRNGIVPLVDKPVASPDESMLLCVGRLTAQKGFDRAIAAFAQVASQMPAVRLKIAGGGEDWPDLADLAAELGIDDRVDFLGIVDRAAIAELFKQCTALLMSSHYEGLPLVALEAAWAARPVVATDAPGVSEAVIDGKTGLLAGPDDIDGLAERALRVLGDRDHARSLGLAARAWAEETSSMPVCVELYRALYERVIAAAGESRSGGDPLVDSSS